MSQSVGVGRRAGAPIGGPPVSHPRCSVRGRRSKAPAAPRHSSPCRRAVHGLVSWPCPTKLGYRASEKRSRAAASDEIGGCYPLVLIELRDYDRNPDSLQECTSLPDIR